MRQKDLNICLGFPVNGSETRPSLPPLVVQRFRSWSCNICLGEHEFNMDDIQSNHEGTKETLTHKSDHTRKEIDVNKIIDLTGDSDDSESDRMSINEEQRNEAEVSINEITGNFKIIPFYLLRGQLLQIMFMQGIVRRMEKMKMKFRIFIKRSLP